MSYGSTFGTLSTSAIGAGLSTTLDTLQPGVLHTLTISPLKLSGSYTASVNQGSTQLGKVTMTAMQTYNLSFTPTATSVSLTISANTATASSIQFTGWTWYSYVNEPEPVVVTICGSDVYRYGMNGKAKDNQWAGLGNHYDYGDRMQDPRIGRWLSIDQLTGKYPNLSPYNFVANNPIAFKDYNGNDFGLKVNNDNHTIVVTANYYTIDAKSYQQAENAAKDLNSYQATVSIDGVSYTMTFQAKVVAADGNTSYEKNINAYNSTQNDNEGNMYHGTLGSAPIEDGAEGGETRGNDIRMFNADIVKPGDSHTTTVDEGDNPKMLNHEMLHTMGNDDHPGGRMEYVGANEDMKDLSSKDVQQILNYALNNDGPNRPNNKLGEKATITQSGNGDIKKAKNVIVKDVSKNSSTSSAGSNIPSTDAPVKNNN